VVPKNLGDIYITYPVHKICNRSVAGAVIPAREILRRNDSGMNKPVDAEK
jgi:hypothetical protein